MTFLDAKLQGFGDHAGYRHGLNITKHLTNLKMFHLSRFNLHVNEEACHREEGSKLDCGRNQGLMSLLLRSISEEVGILMRVLFYCP